MPASVFPSNQRTRVVSGGPILLAGGNQLYANGSLAAAPGVALIAPNTKYQERWNQLDLSVRKTFQFGRKRIQPQLAIFNTLNGNVVLAENEQYGTALPNVTTADGRGQPRNVLQGRMMRLAVLFEF